MRPINREKSFIFLFSCLMGWALSKAFLEVPELPPEIRHIFDGAPVPFLVSVYLFAVVFLGWLTIQLMKWVCA
jgi:hypothetical protein